MFKNKLKMTRFNQLYYISNNKIRATAAPVPAPAKLLTWSKSRLNIIVNTRNIGVTSNKNNNSAINSILNVQKELEAVHKVLNEHKLVNRKGYVTYKEILDRDLYPSLVSKMESFLNRDDKKGGVVDIKMLSDFHLMKIIYWSNNVLLLEQYLKILKNLRKGVLTSDLEMDWDLIMRDILSRIDTSIRHKLENRGITVYKNIYSGYDTEYQNLEYAKNKLLSVQLAVSSKLMIKIPIQEAYHIEKVNALSYEKYKIAFSSCILFPKIETELNSLIKQVRFEKNYKNDVSLDVIVSGLKNRGLSYITKDGYVIFSFERTPIKQWFNAVNEYTLAQVVTQSKNMVQADLDSNEADLYKLLKTIFDEWVLSGGSTLIEEGQNSNKKKKEKENKQKGEKGGGNNNNNDDNKIDLKLTEPTKILIKPLTEEKLNKVSYEKSKKYTRSWRSSFTDDKISITTLNNNYLMGHLTAADLSILSDFDQFKDELSIVNGCCVTLTKPIQLCGLNVYVRDTMLLAPGLKKGLADIGKMYGDCFNKIEIDKDWYTKMEKFLETQPDKFREYAMRDSLIALIHGMYMENFNLGLRKLGVPLTLSSLTSTNLKNEWEKVGYDGYQLSRYTLGEPNEIQTPRGLDSSGYTSLNLGMYIINYKGGRNECFMYGRDTATTWYDYDLTSAYTTVMSLLCTPLCSSGRKLTIEEIDKMSDYELIFSYIIIKVRFKFPSDTKYPSIPCKVDETTTVYPLEGEGYLTGSEYVLAKSQGCSMTIEDNFYIPFKGVADLNDKTLKSLKSKKISDCIDVFVNCEGYKPFRICIQELQEKRRQYPKSTIENQLYKELGNSLYGLIAKGISNKMKYDTKLGITTRVRASDLTNPILASWITSFTRSVIGELLHEISLLGGRVISVTTDGFLTDIPDLESKLSDKNILIRIYQAIRMELSKDPTALELKGVNTSMLSWTTRGQLGTVTVAATGLQRRFYTTEELKQILNEVFESSFREYGYVQRSLRSALDIYKHGGSVTPIYKNRVFRMNNDNRRIYDDENGKLSPLNTLIDSRPMHSADQCALNRFVSNLPKAQVYHKVSQVGITNLKYRSNIDIAVKAFISGLFTEAYGVKMNKFKQYRDIVDFIKVHIPTYKLSENNIALIKHRSVNYHKIPVDPEVEEFARYVKTKYPKFNISKFLDKT